MIKITRRKPTIEAVSTIYKVQSGDISVFIWVHDGYIEIVDDEQEKKPYIFAGKDSQKKRELWLNVLKTLESAIKLIPEGNK